MPMTMNDNMPKNIAISRNEETANGFLVRRFVSPPLKKSIFSSVACLQKCASTCSRVAYMVS